MATMNVSLPDPMKNWVEKQTRGGRYSNASDYVRDLIRKDQEEEMHRRYLQTAIDEGVASGVSGRSLDQVFKRARSFKAG